MSQTVWSHLRISWAKISLVMTVTTAVNFQGCAAIASRAWTGLQTLHGVLSFPVSLLRVPTGRAGHTVWRGWPGTQRGEVGTVAPGRGTALGRGSAHAIPAGLMVLR